MTAHVDAPQLLVADSFRVRGQAEQAEVRGFSRHLARFAGAVRSALRADPAGEVAPLTVAPPGPEETRLPGFLGGAAASIATYGAGFPRLEMWRDPSGEIRYELALRALPELGETLTMRSAPGSVVAHPGRKGPNISAFTALNRELGAEALLLDPRGRALEGATTSLVYWTDAGPRSGHVVADQRRVASITESLVSDAAQRRPIGSEPHHGRGGAFSAGSPTVETLQGCEVWALNALHGIRPVTHIDGVALPVPEPERLDWFRRALERSWERCLAPR